MRFPKPLTAGSTIGLIAPASPVSQAELERCIESLKTLGYQTIIGTALKESVSARGYLAGAPQMRAKDVNEMFQNPKVEAVFCIRGGYGSSQIMAYLDFQTIIRNPKIFLGYSDITNLHTVLQRYCRLVTFHGPMVKPDMMDGIDDYSKSSLLAALNMEIRLEFKNPGNEPFVIYREGSAQGMITGGNLAVLCRSLGTFYQPDTDGKILYLEDTAETAARVDMYLTQLQNAGFLDGVKGVLLGGFTSRPQEDIDAYGNMEDFFREWFSNYPFPVMGNIYSDHRHPMGTIPFGTTCFVDSGNNKISFQYQTP